MGQAKFFNEARTREKQGCVAIKGFSGSKADY